MSKDKKYYQRIVEDIRKKNPDLEWDQLLRVIKESIDHDIESN